MKVCQLCAVDFTLEKFLLPLIDGMTNAGWDVTSVCSDGPVLAGLEQRGYVIHRIGISRSMNPVRHTLSLFKLVRFFRQERFDVVHVHTPVAALLGRIAAWVARTPLVVYTAHGFYFHDDMPVSKRAFFILLERFAGYCTHLLFTQSEEDANTVKEENIISSDQLFVIGNGVDAGRFDPAVHENRSQLRASLGIPEDAYVVGMIGRMVEEKGVVDYLNAILQVAENHSHVYFLLIGERLASDHAPAVTDAIDRAKTKLGKRLVLTGLRSDIPDLLFAMDLFCLPSWREGMPRTIIEAMMMGKPVVATDIRGSREEVVHGETGLLVPVRRPDSLAEAINKCVTDPVQAEKMGQSGRERALKLYDESRIVEFQINKIKEFARCAGLLN